MPTINKYYINGVLVEDNHNLTDLLRKECNNYIQTSLRNKENFNIGTTKVELIATYMGQKEINLIGAIYELYEDIQSVSFMRDVNGHLYQCFAFEDINTFYISLDDSYFAFIPDNTSMSVLDIMKYTENMLND